MLPSKNIHPFLLVLIVLVYSGCAGSNPGIKDYVYQVSTLNSLKDGDYNGIAELSELVKHGNHGLGTFNAIDGEMIIHNGTVYRAEFNGNLTLPGDSEKTPFAVITDFEYDHQFEATDVTCENLKSLTENSFENKKKIYAVKISGLFGSLKFRSVKKQEKPFPPLSIVVENQNIMEEDNIKGTAVGYWFPGELGGVNETGFHLHFINTELSRGGHILDCNLKSGVVYIDDKKELLLSIEQTGKKGEP